MIHQMQQLIHLLKQRCKDYIGGVNLPIWLTALISLGVPSCILGFGIWLIEHRIQKREDKREEIRKKEEKEREERENAREMHEIYIIKSIDASIALSEATARAVQRIPDAHCNGDMHAALEYAAKVKHEKKDFLNEQALKQLY